MYLLENPILHRDLLANLRTVRGFVLLFAYLALLAGVVYLAWPSQQRLDLTRISEESKRLVNLFFLGQYLLISLLTPAFAAGTITGEKERKTYEMLLASPLRPAAIVLGKLLASLCHLGVLVFCSLPIVMLCLPLGGVSLYEVLGTYVAMAASTTLFGMISITASSYFHRTVAALLVSYLLILPLSLLGVAVYAMLEMATVSRLFFLVGVIPAVCLLLSARLLHRTSARLLHPPDVGAEAQEVVDLEQEQQQAVGMVIRGDQFPDRLFTPPKRNDLLPDGVNPIFDKEMRSEIFGQGTLMLRVVIQMSMFLALPLMAFFLYLWPQYAPWYANYVVLFSLLVGPVFSAGAITSERERQTLELLLTTTLTPWQILWGKLLSSLRVSCVLTSFLIWPLALAWILPPFTYLQDTLTMLGYLAVIFMTSLTTTVLPMFCSVIFRKTSASMLTSYLVLLGLFALPLAMAQFAALFFPNDPAAVLIHGIQFTSPFAAALSLPLGLGAPPDRLPIPSDVNVFVSFLGFYLALNVLLTAAMVWMFNRRWRVTG